MPALRERIVTAAHQRAVSAGKVPRRPYAHYFIEADGLHSRLHLQNYYSTFWPDVDEPAVAHVTAFASDGTRLGTTDVELPRSGRCSSRRATSSNALARTRAKGSSRSTSSRPPACEAA